jgi:hypothetical protein
MEYRNVDCEMELGDPGSGLCPAASFSIDGVEFLGSAAMAVVHFEYVYERIIQRSLLNHGLKWLLNFLGARL